MALILPDISIRLMNKDKIMPLDASRIPNDIWDNLIVLLNSEATNYYNIP